MDLGTQEDDLTLYLNSDIDIIVQETDDSINAIIGDIAIIEKGKGVDCIDTVYECAYPIGGHRVVCIKDGKLEYFDSSNVFNYNRAIGVTLQSGLTNEPIQVREKGKITNIGWGLTKDAFYYSNTSGVLTTVYDNALFTQIGYAISADDFIVDIKNSIIY